MAATLVLGGARSGKSRFALAAAEAEAARLGSPPLMIATAEAGDEEMAERIALHRAERSAAWRTEEEPLELAAALNRLRPGEAAVVDCLTLWLSNLLMHDRDLARESDALAEATGACRGAVWIVSNEVGWGLVPDHPLARRFRDAQGRLNQQVAAAAAGAVLVAAGLPLWLKRPEARP